MSATLRLDERKRITLPKGVIPEQTTGFAYKVLDSGDIVLTPMVEIPAREQWLYEDKEALASLERGLAQAKEGKFAEPPKGA